MPPKTKVEKTQVIVSITKEILPTKKVGPCTVKTVTYTTCLLDKNNKPCGPCSGTG
jgi:hypothetical protein